MDKDKVNFKKEKLYIEFLFCILGLLLFDKNEGIFFLMFWVSCCVCFGIFLSGCCFVFGVLLGLYYWYLLFRKKNFICFINFCMKIF